MNFLHDFEPQSVAFNLGSWSVNWYGIIIALAVVTGLLITLYIAKKKQVKSDHFYNLLFWIIIFSLVGGRLAHLLAEWNYYQADWSNLFKIWQGGLSIFGVLLGAILVVVIYSRIKKISFWLLVDIIVVSLPLMQAIGRWGNYFNQELYGQATDLSWGLPIRMAGEVAYYHPLFLYESILMLAVFTLLFYLSRQGKLQLGRLTLLYFVLFAVIRFSLDFIRFDPPMWGALSIAQWVSMFIIVLIIIIGTRMKQQPA